MSGDNDSESSDGGFKLYHFNPSFAAAVLFAVLFGGVSIRHLQLLIRSRTWAFIPFLIGCLCTSLSLPLDNLPLYLLLIPTPEQLKRQDTLREPTQPGKRPTGRLCHISSRAF